MTEPAQTNVITNDIETQDPNSSMPTLFRHMKRESWGLGILQSDRFRGSRFLASANSLFPEFADLLQILVGRLFSKK